MTDAEMKEFAVKSARLNAATVLRKRAAMMAGLAKSLEKSAYDIENGESEKNPFPVSSGEKMTWAMNDIENMIRNINFAELARRAAALEVASNMKGGE